MTRTRDNYNFNVAATLSALDVYQPLYFQGETEIDMATICPSMHNMDRQISEGWKIVSCRLCIQKMLIGKV